MLDTHVAERERTIVVGLIDPREKGVGAIEEEPLDELAGLVVAGAEKILRREVDAKAHADILADVQKQL